MTQSPTTGYALGGCGCLLTLIATCVALFGAFHVFIDPRGAISADEAAPALGGGCCCMFPSVLLIGGGVFMAMRANKAQAAEQPKPPAA